MAIRIEQEVQHGNGTEVEIMNVYGQNADELLEFMIPRIRRQSQEFYRICIREELRQDGRTLVDHHAAGVRTRLYLEPANPTPYGAQT